MQKDPLTHQYNSIFMQTLFSLLVFFSAFYVCALLFTNLLHITSFLSLMPWQFFALLLLIFCTLYSIGNRKQWETHTALRQRALSADPSVIAIPQPAPNPNYTLTLPMTILLQPNFKRVRNSILGGFIFLLLFLFGTFIVCLNIFPLNIAFPLFAFSILVLLPIFIFWVTRLRKARSPLSQQRIEVTEQGLSVSYQGKIASLAWEDARLFTSSNFKQRTLPHFYELSGKQGSLLWMQTLPNKTLSQYQYLAPAIPFEEYLYQMQALHALVATKTQLPLYDLYPSTTQKINPIPTASPQ